MKRPINISAETLGRIVASEDKLNDANSQS